jgi:hypothetical protein
MVRKKTEGDEDQRRAAALEAERAGELPSTQGTTTGASKQRTHRSTSTDHEEKVASLHRGKQQWPVDISGGRPPPVPPGPTFRGRGHPDYSDAHEEIFRALTEAEAQSGGEGVYLEEVARRAGIAKDRARELLHDLIVAHGLVTELQGTDTPDMGPRYEVKPRF